MRILISNDDGIHAKGLEALRQNICGLGDVFVVAPDRERSATGHGITVDRPLRIKEVHYKEKNTHGWAVDGTPADCVKLAVEDLLPGKPDLVLAGINIGPNLGTDVLYSGTVSAAIEGLINGIPSIAFSLACHHCEPDFSNAGPLVAEFLPQVMRHSIPPNTLININIPSGKPKGFKVTRLGSRRYVNIFHKREDPRGRIYYWMAGEPMELDKDTSGTDVKAVEEGYISITPIKIDLTDYKTLDMMKEWNL